MTGPGETAISIFIVILFLIFIYAGMRKQTMKEVFSDIISLVKGGRPSAQDLVNEVDEMEGQKWRVK